MPSLLPPQWRHLNSPRGFITLPSHTGALVLYLIVSEHTCFFHLLNSDPFEERDKAAFNFVAKLSLIQGLAV